MGMDFSALIHYDGVNSDVLATIHELELNPHHSTMNAVVELGRKEDFAFASERPVTTDWRAYSDWETALTSRPSLPSVKEYLQLPSDFTLTFGQDAIWVYHTLRWLFFTTEPKWQTVMLNAVRYFCRRLHGHDCIVTSDYNPAILEFQNGASFSAAVTAAESAGEGRVNTIDDLYIDKGIADDLVFVDADGQQSAIPIWASHGYLRLQCNAQDAK